VLDHGGADELRVRVEVRRDPAKDVFEEGHVLGNLNQHEVIHTREGAQ